MNEIKLKYSVDLSMSFRQQIGVEFCVEGLPESTNPIKLLLPSWSPGSYMIREYARNVQEFEVFSNIDGSRISWERTEKDTWSVDWLVNERNSAFTAKWIIHAAELSVRTSHADHTHAFIHGPSIFMYIPELRNHPVSLVLKKPAEWDVATSLRQLDASSFQYTAPTYDRLIDSPIEVGTLKISEFSFDDREHLFAFSGAGLLDPDSVATDMSEVPIHCKRIFKTLPFEKYTFLVSFRGRTGGGLEHFDSSANIVSPGFVSDGENYEKLLRLLTHEYFHLWNGKNLCAAATRFPEYRFENYTKLLWFTEGATTYYQDIILLRSGLISEKRYVNLLADRISLYQNRPGKLLASPEEASLLSWIKHYHPDHNTENTVPNYYIVGSLIALSLNLEIIQRTNGKKSLDDLMRQLLFKYKNTGIPEDGLKETAEEIADSSFQDFFKENVESSGEIDLDHYLEIAGFFLKHESEPSDDGEMSRCRSNLISRGCGGRLGIRLAGAVGTAIIGKIIAGGAADKSFLCPGDEIVAIDGLKVSTSNFETTLDRYASGNTVEITVFRHEMIHRIPVELGINLQRKLVLTNIAPGTSERQAFRKKWFYGI